MDRQESSDEVNAGGCFCKHFVSKFCSNLTFILQMLKQGMLTEGEDSVRLTS